MPHWFYTFLAWLEVKFPNLLAMQKTWVPSLGQEDPLEKVMAPYSSILAWRIPWIEEPRATVQSVGHDWTTKHTHIQAHCKLEFEWRQADYWQKQRPDGWNMLDKTTEMMSCIFKKIFFKMVLWWPFLFFEKSAGQVGARKQSTATPLPFSQQIPWFPQSSHWVCSD